MTDKDLYGGMIRLHILHHAAKEPVFGLGIIEELRHHGYQLSPGTLYPMLHGMEKKGYLTSRHVQAGWICPYISRHLLSLNPLLARCRRYSRGER